MNGWPWVLLEGWCPDASTVEIAARLGFHEDTVRRWRRRGVVPWVQADRVATLLGRHPSEIAGYEEWAAWAVLLDARREGRTRRCRNCRCEFVLAPRRSSRSPHVFCCRRCGSAFRARRAYRSDRSVRIAKRAANRAYKAEISQLAARRGVV